MDKTLASLFAAWWLSGNTAATRVLIECLHELSVDDAVDVLIEFRSVVQTMEGLGRTSREPRQAGRNVSKVSPMHCRPHRTLTRTSRRETPARARPWPARAAAP